MAGHRKHEAAPARGIIGTRPGTPPSGLFILLHVEHFTDSGLTLRMDGRNVKDMETKDAIKALRKARGWNTKALAFQMAQMGAGVSWRTVENWEQG